MFFMAWLTYYCGVKHVGNIGDLPQRNQWISRKIPIQQHTSVDEDCFVHLSVSSADAERAFPLVNNIKNKLRNCLGPPMLDALCVIASEGPAEDDFDYEEAVEFWHDRKKIDV